MHLIKEKIIKSTMFVSIVALVSAALLVILFGVKQFKLGSQISGENQAANISHLLVRQQANLFSMLLLNKASSDKLSENLDNFTKEQFVVNAAIYAANGQLLAKSSNGNQPSNDVQPIVEPIYSSNGLEGFLRVGFDDKYGQTTQHKIDLIFHRLYGELIIVFLLGILAASSFHYFLSHYRRSKRKHSAEPREVKMPAKTENSQNFHRRRKRFTK